MPSFVVRSPLPKYRAADSLRRQLIEHLLSGGFRVGDPFLSDREVMEAAGRSRTAVRRALEHLQREGWIELAAASAHSSARALPYPPPSAEVSVTSDKRLVRLAAVAAGLGHLPHDWYSGMILHGIDEASVDDAITVELLGDHHAKPRAWRGAWSIAGRTFCLHRPAVGHTSVIGEADAWGSPAF